MSSILHKRTHIQKMPNVTGIPVTQTLRNTLLFPVVIIVAPSLLFTVVMQNTVIPININVTC